MGIVGKEEHESAKEKTAQEKIDEHMPSITDASPMDAEKKEFVILSEEDHHFVISSQVLDEKKSLEPIDVEQNSEVAEDKKADEDSLAETNGFEAAAETKVSQENILQEVKESDSAQDIQVVPGNEETLHIGEKKVSDEAQKDDKQVKEIKEDSSVDLNEQVSLDPKAEQKSSESSKEQIDSEDTEEKSTDEKVEACGKSGSEQHSPQVMKEQLFKYKTELFDEMTASKSVAAEERKMSDMDMVEVFEDHSETDLSSADTSRRTSEVGQSFSERRQSAHELKKLFVKKLSERDFGLPEKTDELEDVAEEIVATETKQDGNKQDCKQDTKSISEYVADEEKICKTDDVNEKVELESFNEAEESKDQNDSNETQTHTCADDPYCSSSKTEENKETEVEISDNKNLVSSEVEEKKDHDEASAEKASSDVEETESSPEGKDKVSFVLKDEGCLPSTKEKVPQNGSEPHIEK